VAVHFKGSGFYTTDYARKAPAKATSDGGGDSESKRESKRESKGDAKPAKASSSSKDE
jgi:predicted nucleic acid-binding Zn ribbon protein